MKKLLIMLMIVSIVLIMGCKTTQDPEIFLPPLFMEVIPLPSRPILEVVPQDTSKSVKVLSDNILEAMAHIKLLEGYAKNQETYYKTIFYPQEE